MGKIISEDATNIHFPISCDVLVDDVRGITVIGKKGRYNQWFNNSKADLMKIRSYCDPAPYTPPWCHYSSNPQWGPLYSSQMMQDINPFWRMGL